MEIRLGGVGWEEEGALEGVLGEPSVVRPGCDGRTGLMAVG